MLPAQKVQFVFCFQAWTPEHCWGHTRSVRWNTKGFINMERFKRKKPSSKIDKLTSAEKDCCSSPTSASAGRRTPTWTWQWLPPHSLQTAPRRAESTPVLVLGQGSLTGAHQKELPVGFLVSWSCASDRLFFTHQLVNTALLIYVLFIYAVSQRKILQGGWTVFSGLHPQQQLKAQSHCSPYFLKVCPF